MQKDTYFQMRCTKDESRLLHQAAKFAGFKSASDYARSLLIPAASALLSGDNEKLMRVLNSTGNLMMTQASIKQDTSG